VLEAPVHVFVAAAGSLHDTVEADELADNDPHAMLTMAQTRTHRGSEMLSGVSEERAPVTDTPPPNTAP
jgi:hypothetical protein